MKKKEVFVLGDSISCYYGKYLEKMLKERFSYDRKGGRIKFKSCGDGIDGTNGGDSSKVLMYVKAVTSLKSFKPDYFLLNCGLHDVKKDRVSGRHQIPPGDYRNNITEACQVLQKKGIRVIWVRTTPVNKGYQVKVSDQVATVRDNRDVLQYNRIADDVISSLNIYSIDLYTFTRNLGEDIYFDGLHFKEDATALQAAFIAGHLYSLENNNPNY